MASNDVMARAQLRILVVASTWWGAPARLASALAGAQCHVATLCPPGHPLLHVSTAQERYRYSCYRPLHALRTAIAASRPDLVLPTDDRCVGHLHAVYADAAPSVRAVLRRSLGPPQHFATVESRFELLQLAGRMGIRVPPTRRFSTAESLDGWDDPFPRVVKSSGTWGGAGVQIVTDAAAARTAFRALGRPVDTARALKRWTVNRDGFSLEPWLMRRRPEVIAQRYIAGRPANIAVACWEGEVLATLAVEALRTQGTTGATAVARVINAAEMTAAARCIVEGLALSGLHGFDFMLDDADRSWLIEMNPRATQLCHFGRGGGASLAEHLAARLGGDGVPASGVAPAGTVIALFPQAWFGQPHDPLLATALHDVPWEEPALIRELTGAPWPNRSWMARLWQGYVRPQQWDAWMGSVPAPDTRQPDSAAA